MHSQNHISIPPRAENEPTQMENLNSWRRNHKIWLKSCIVALIHTHLLHKQLTLSSFFPQVILTNSLNGVVG
ncbi:hypothetical protein VIGAN_04247400 [Vigna angularis var. angularis]|uniref:Uncharacterized protein n=1 Tax=Vigna angularis var. angularis TaxID=157739 RepID=A0A0S3RWN8_PHAAN|nr:hypothetical protein VIGAN_04247400 [Vigna angularis var. angularis]